MTEQDQVRQIMDAKAQAPLVPDPRTTALAVVDVQRYFVHGQYPFMRTFETLQPGVTEGYRRRTTSIVVPNIARLQQTFRSYGAAILEDAVAPRLPRARRAQDLQRCLVLDAARPAAHERRDPGRRRDGLTTDVCVSRRRELAAAGSR